MTATTLRTTGSERRHVAPAVYRRRRLGVLGAAAVAGALLVSAVGHGGTAGAGDDGQPGPPAVYVVQPGDTLWSIATELAPGRDPRAVVGRLRAAAGGVDLQPGQRIELPGGLS